MCVCHVVNKIYLLTYLLTKYVAFEVTQTSTHLTIIGLDMDDHAVTYFIRQPQR